MNNKAISVLFVCLGNICRSPAGEGILRELAKNERDLDIHTESCGMGDWHVGQLPDPRMQQAAKERGIILSSKAQVFDPVYLEHFDYIMAADQRIKQDLYQYAETPEQKAKIHLMTEFSSLYKGMNVPDPYYKGQGDFDLVLDMLKDSCIGLIEHIKKKNVQV